MHCRVAFLSTVLLTGCGTGIEQATQPPTGAGSTPSQEPSEQVPARRASQEATATSAHQHDSAPAGRAAEIPLRPLDLPGEQLLDDPSLADWDTELLNEAAGKQLKAVEKLLADPTKLDAAHLAPLVMAEFRCGRLRPSEWTVPFEDQSLRVRRPATADALQAAEQLKGAEALAAALKELREPLDGAADIHSKVKIFHVTIDGPRAETELYFHLSGRTAQGIHEQNATWRVQWRLSASKTPLLAGIDVTDYEEAAAKQSSGPLFADCTEAVLAKNASYREQLAYSLDHWLDRIEYRYGLDAAGWEGIALGDVNGDDRDDLFVCQGGGLPNRLYVQNADGTATDISAEAGIDLLDSTHAALFVDFDNDGDQDLALAISVGVLIFANDGQGQFTRMTYKLLPDGMPYSLSAADYDNDSDLDLYVCCYSPRESGLTRRFLGRPIPYHDANNGSRNVLLRNDRNGTFRDVTAKVGLGENNHRFSFAAAWEDYDNDGDQDLHVANDYGRDNLYRNDDGQFHDVAPAVGVDDVSAGMSSAWGDVNEDGLMDLYVSNMWSSAGNRITFQNQFQSEADAETRGLYQRHARGNALFLNDGNGAFRDVSVEARVTMGRWAWGSRFVDLNNDGREEILVANGFLTQDDPDDL